MEEQKVWYVTGASKGLGLALVKKLLAAGHCVIATSRNEDALAKAVGTDNVNFLPLQVDLTDDASVGASIQRASKKFGRIDVIVNNAGYGIGGAVEELSEKETKDSFEVNVFGPLRVMRHAMPLLREQQQGHIINISSIAGFAPNTGWAMYAGTKFALVGISEVTAEDARALGIHITVVLPGAFRTQFLSDDSLVFSEKKIAAYQGIRASHNRYVSMHGTQAGSPEKAADALISLTAMPQPPVRFYLGSDAYKRAADKLAALTGELETQKTISATTDF